ncbi:MAG TPA: flavodoxin domain-containing protein [Kofleriaceae bacterium]|nr:flavodoxin domain-containing protein [Kofleriaceae bacterium]
MKRVLVAYGSKRGGTAEIALRIAETLRQRGLEVDCKPAGAVRELSAYDAVLVGGGLYAGRWLREARRFVVRHAAELRTRPVWMFSSGPLDASAREHEILPSSQVRTLMARIGARGHATFGGRLKPDARGFPASAMAKTMSGDWRDWGQVTSWAAGLVSEIEGAPRPVRAASELRDPRRWLLALLLLLVGPPAIGGGLTLVWAPDGSLLHMPPSQLDHSPFSSFLIPGLLLLLVIGVGNTLAAVLVLARSRIADIVAFAAGAALLVFIVTEMVMLRSAHWLQLGYFAMSVLIMAESLRRRARSSPRLIHATAT